MDNTWFEKMEERIPRGEVRTRFAPSPTGYMHVGNLRTALYTWCIARHAHGKFLLRIEDTDQSRQVEGAVEVIYKTLRDCGLDHDEGPDVGGPVGPYVQTERRDTYLPYAKRLVERGHAYYCFCDKTESEEDSGDFTRKDDPCRDLSAEEVQRRLDAGMPWVIRQKIPTRAKRRSTTRSSATSPRRTPISTIRCSSSATGSRPTTSQTSLTIISWASPTSCAAASISPARRSTTFCTRVSAGTCRATSTARPSCATRTTNVQAPRRPSYEDLVAQGFLTEAIVNYVALLGWAPGGEAGDLFDQRARGGVRYVPHLEVPGHFRYRKAHVLQQRVHQGHVPQAFARAAEPWIRKAVKTESYDPALIAAILQQRTEKLSDIPEKLGFFDTLPEYDTALYVHKKSKCDETVALDMLKKMRPASRGHHRLDGGRPCTTV